MVVATALSASCALPSAHKTTGGLLVIVNSARTLTIEPDTDMIPAQYVITGFGPYESSVATTSQNETVTMDRLLIGEWTIVVSAENAAGALIAQGESSTRVNSGKIAPLAISVRPIPGAGSFDITVEWEAAQVESPDVTARLLPATGDPLDLTFVLGSGSAYYSSALIDSGYYTLTTQLADTGIVVAGAVETVRIVTGQITSGRVGFGQLNAPGGTIDVLITPDLQEPLIVSISGQVPSLPSGTSMTAQGTVDSFTGNVINTWYLNGDSIAIGDNCTLGADLQPGFYRLDLTTFSADGTRAGSVSHTFTVTE
jgi:hypothetical protein